MFRQAGVVIVVGVEKMDKEFDIVNRPEHYANGNVECIDAMCTFLGDKAVMNFCLGNVFKYLWRHEFKNHEVDIKKAVWYFDKFKELCNKSGC
jgi:hypothetical protein